MTRNAIIVFGMCIFIILAFLCGNIILGVLGNNATQPTLAQPDTSTEAPTPTQMPQQTYQQPATNTIDCIGPDGKHLQVTQQECDNFNNAW